MFRLPLIATAIFATACTDDKADDSGGGDPTTTDDTGTTPTDDTGTTDPPTDNDKDGYVPVAEGGDDCDDNNPFVNPGMDEVCGDKLDNHNAG